MNVSGPYEAKVRTALAAMGASEIRKNDVAETWALPNGSNFRCALRGADPEPDYWRNALNNLRRIYGGLLPAVDDAATNQREGPAHMTTTKKLTDEERAEIRALRSDGMSTAEIKAKTGRSEASIHRTLKGLARGAKKADAPGNAMTTTKVKPKPSTNGDEFELTLRMPGGLEAKSKISRREAEALSLRILCGELS